MKLRLPSFQHYLVHFYVDNLVYRAEIRMNWKGRLKWGSPVIQGHFLMVAIMAAVAATWWQLGIQQALNLSACFMALATFGGYFVAFWLGFHSLARERVACTLEPLCLTLLSDEEIMDGKFYGALAPYKETRRYLYPHCLFIAGAVIYTTRDPYRSLATVVALMIALNHLNFSYFMGALAGLHSAQIHARSMIGAMITEREYMVILPEVGLFLRTFFGFLILLAATAIVWYVGLPDHPWLLIIPCFAFPLEMYGRLQNIQQYAHDKLKHQFKKKIVFD